MWFDLIHMNKKNFDLYSKKQTNFGLFIKDTPLVHDEYSLCLSAYSSVHSGLEWK